MDRKWGFIDRDSIRKKFITYTRFIFKNYFKNKEKRWFLFFLIYNKRYISHRSFFFKTHYDTYVLKTIRISSKQSLFKVKRSKIRKYLLNVWESESRCISRANILRNYFIILHYHILIIIFRRRSFTRFRWKMWE